MKRIAVSCLVAALIGTMSPGLAVASHQLPTSAATRDQHVVEIQFVLRSFGYSVTVDGLYGPQTTRAVRHWQRANGLVVDGVAGTQTWASLTAATVPTASAPATRLNPPTPSIEEIIRSAWPDDSEDRAVAIATRESRLVPTARNACCYGLFQINWPAHRSWLVRDFGLSSPTDLLDASTNVRVAVALFEQAGWAPWSL